MSRRVRVDGRCHCGAIEFEAEVDTDKVVICHCVDCQILASAPYRVTVFSLQDAFWVRRGRPKVYVKTAESGNKREQGFCGDCGSSLYATSVGEGPKVYGVRLGVLRQRDTLHPTLQIWRGSALPWSDAVRELPAIPGQP